MPYAWPNISNLLTSVNERSVVKLTMDSGLLSNNQFLPPQSTGQNTPPQSGGRFKLGKRAVIGLVASAVAVGGYLVMAGEQKIWPVRVDEVVVDSFTDL